jgi:predicted peroxiredoxin
VTKEGKENGLEYLTDEDAIDQLRVSWRQDALLSICKLLGAVTFVQGQY